MPYLGEMAALMAALCWTATSVSFEYAGKRIGSGAVNIWRLVMALVILTLFNGIWEGVWLNLDIPINQVILLVISGLIGFVLGDLFLFEAFVIVGARISMLVMALSPPLSALIGFVVLGEQMTIQGLFGMLVTFSGIALVILSKNKGERVKLSHPVKGILFAFLGALGQSVGLLFSKMGMVGISAFEASQYRVMAGLLGFIILLGIQRRFGEVREALSHPRGMAATGVGAFFGPFLGVSMSLLAVSLTSLGIASTLMSIVPVLLIPVSILVFKERVSLKEALGAIITVFGVSMMFM